MKFMYAVYAHTLTPAQATAANRLVALDHFSSLYPEVQDIKLLEFSSTLSMRLLGSAADRADEIGEELIKSINLSLVQNLVEQKDISNHVPNQKPHAPPRPKLRWN